MHFELFKSIIDKYPLKILYDSSCAKEYQYINPDVCRFLIVKFSIMPNFIEVLEVPYGFCYSKKEKHIVPTDKNHILAYSYLSYKHISFPSEKEVYEEISRIIKNLKQVQYNLKLERIKSNLISTLYLVVRKNNKERMKKIWQEV